MAERVVCIVRGDKDRYADCRCITQLTTEAAIYSRLEAHTEVTQYPGLLYVEVAGSRATLIPAEREGLKYVRTAPTDTMDDNLLKVRLLNGCLVCTSSIPC